MSDTNIFELLKDCKELRSLPQVLAEVVRATDKDENGAGQIAEIIMKDPALSARLLRVANSAFYGSSREVSTITQAVVTMGLRAVKAMALSAGLYKLFDSDQALVDRPASGVIRWRWLSPAGKSPWPVPTVPPRRLSSAVFCMISGF